MSEANPKETTMQRYKRLFALPCSCTVGEDDRGIKVAVIKDGNAVLAEIRPLNEAQLAPMDLFEKFSTTFTVGAAITEAVNMYPQATERVRESEELIEQLLVCVREIDACSTDPLGNRRETQRRETQHKIIELAGRCEQRVRAYKQKRGIE